MSATQNLPVWDFDDYRKYLSSVLDAPTARGQRTALAQACRIHPAYVTHVTKGRADFSAEQALAVGQFLGLADLERRYFLALVQRARASTPELKAFYGEELRELLRAHADLQRRLRTDREMDPAMQAVYYARWHVSAIHIALAVPALRRPAALARAFRLPPNVVGEALDFLVATGLAKRQRSGTYLPDRAPLHLTRDSPFILRHHANWRMKALESMEARRPDSFHYSSVVSIDPRDREKLREILVKAIEKFSQTVRRSEPEGAVFSYAIDFFRVDDRA